jgi:surfeit locus 1 family protein
MADETSIIGLDATIAVESMKGISIGRYQFAPKVIPTLAAVLVFMLTVSLGNWQTRRAAEKTILQQRLDAHAVAPPIELTQQRVEPSAVSEGRVRVRGHFLADRTLFIDNRIHRGVAGYHVVTPLRIEDGPMHVLVNRGWIAAGSRRDQLPVVNTPESSVVIEGLATIPLAQPYELAPDTTEGPLRQNLVPQRLEAELKLMLQPIVILQTSAAADRLVREWPKPDAGVNTHRAYALQWYVMAVLTAGMWVVLNLSKAKRHD